MKRLRKARFLIRKNRLKQPSERYWSEYIKAMGLVSAIAVVTFTLIYGYLFSISSPYFRIQDTKVRGCRELTEKDVLTLAALEPRQTIFSANIKAIARRVSLNPWVKTVAVAREFPNGLVIEVEERTAIAMCRVVEDFYLLDGAGTFFKKLESGDDVDVPILTGYYKDGKLNGNLLLTTISLLKQLAQSKNFPTIHAVSEIHGSDVEGLSLYTDNGFCLELGFDNYDGKLKRLIPVLTALNKKSMNGGFLSIDLRNTSKIYVERRSVLGPVEPVRQKAGFST